MEGFVEGLATGDHPIHVHEYGCLDDGKCMNTGAHYNPKNAIFELGNANGYIGNLDKIVADGNGEADFYQLFKNLPLKGAQSVLGRGIVIHGADGNSARAACGSIVLMESVYDPPLPP